MKYCVPPWMAVVEAEYNKDTKEVRGGENPNILRYHAATSLHASDDETAWCSSFANFCMQQCGLGYKGTGSAQAISWLQWGKSIDGRFGAITVFDHGGGTGHVCFFLCMLDDESFLAIGGNQSDQVKVSTYKLSDVADFRWPNSFADQGGYG